MQLLNGGQRGAFLTGFDHLNITFGHIGLDCKLILAESCLVA